MKKLLLTVLCLGLFGGFVFAQESEKTAEQQKQEKIDKETAADNLKLTEHCAGFQQIVETKDVKTTTGEDGKKNSVTKFWLESKAYSSKTSQDSVVGYWLAAIDGEFPWTDKEGKAVESSSEEKFFDLSALIPASPESSEKPTKTYEKLYREGGFKGLRHYVYKNSETAPQKVIVGASLMDDGALFCPDYSQVTDAYIDSGAGEIPKRKCRERLNELLTRGCAQALNVIFDSASEFDKIKKNNAGEHKKAFESFVNAAPGFGTVKSSEEYKATDLSTVIAEETDTNKKDKIKSLDAKLSALRDSHNKYRKKLEEVQKLLNGDDWKKKIKTYDDELKIAEAAKPKGGDASDKKLTKKYNTLLPVYTPFWDAADSVSSLQQSLGDWKTVANNFSNEVNRNFVEYKSLITGYEKIYLIESTKVDEKNGGVSNADAASPDKVTKSGFVEDEMKILMNAYMDKHRIETKSLEESKEKDKEANESHFKTKKYIQDRIKQIAFSSLSQGVSSFNVSETLSTNSKSIEGDLTLFNDTEDSTNFFDKIIKLVTGIVGTLGVIILIIAIVMLVTANGDDTQISKAKELILYTVVGLLVIFMSYMIIQFVIDLLVF